LVLLYILYAHKLQLVKYSLSIPKATHILIKMS
jgi:hypothetical protein